MAKERFTMHSALGSVRGVITGYIEGNLRTQLRSALELAADKYAENAAHFRAIKPDLIKKEAEDEPGSPLRFIHSSACDPLAEQFDRQAADTRKLLELLDGPEDATDEPIIALIDVEED